MELFHAVSSQLQTRSDAFAEIDLADVNRAGVAPSRCHTHTMVIMVRVDPQLSYDLFDVFPPLSGCCGKAIVKKAESMLWGIGFKGLINKNV